MANGLSQIAIEKLDKNNFQVWKFRIMNFLMGKGYWEFITGDEIEPPLPENPTQQQIQANKNWHEKARKVLNWFSVSVSDSMIVHIQDAKSPKASLGYIDEDVQHQYISPQNAAQAIVA
jgi:hypothetical protein